MTRGIYADLPATEAEYRAGFSLGVAYAEADRRDYANADAELRAEARESFWRGERAFRLGIVRGYREERNR
jgi:hypothetical protein